MRQNVKFFPLVFNERRDRDPIGMFYLGLHNYWFCLGLALFLSVLSLKSHAVDPFSQKLEVFGRRSDPRTESTFFLKSVSQPCLLLHAYLSQILDGVARRADNTGVRYSTYSYQKGLDVNMQRKRRARINPSEK
ncbi:hypothetical protein NPIL_13251 [Nephila pilipes]|uniref:Uncharacterized protein n=1 Tax=Nephila pilipes TaxID=299642 RepID=A0A8X6P645_NEPPI|nr:hypothetical protein NPIL_13251 [Nephila pilipes]